MAYDVLIKNGLIVDGSGLPSFHGDVGVKDGKIVDLGKLSGAASQTVDRVALMKGQMVAVEQAQTRRSAGSSFRGRGRRGLDLRRIAKPCVAAFRPLAESWLQGRAADQ